MNSKSNSNSPAKPIDNNSAKPIDNNSAKPKGNNRAKLTGPFSTPSRRYTLFCESDKYAALSYTTIHNINPALNIGDITAADENAAPDFNTMFGGSPCQDFSTAGRQKGAMWSCPSCLHTYNPLQVHYSKRDKCPKCHNAGIEKTRSSLLVEWLRFLRAKKPRLAVYENVKNITSKKFMPTFELFMAELDDYGYNIYWEMLNARDYGIPQNRERVYCIIIRKDVDNRLFKFPDKIPLMIKLRDLLEDGVHEKYYLSIKEGKRLVVYKPTGIAPSNIALSVPATQNKSAGTHCKVARSSRIRKLTPKECWRLMGFDDKDFDAAATALNNTFYKGKDRSSSQLYKQAGNSIATGVLEQIFHSLYRAMPYLFYGMAIGSFFSGIGAFEKALERMDDVLALDGGLNDVLAPSDRLDDVLALDNKLPVPITPGLRPMPAAQNPTPTIQNPSLNQVGYIGSNSIQYRIYDSAIARTILGEAGGGGAKTGWYAVWDCL